MISTVFCTNIWLAEQAGWDREMLALEAGDLADLEGNLATLGFEVV